MCRIKRPIQPHIRGRWRGKLPRPNPDYVWPSFPSTWPPNSGPTRAIINLPFAYNKYGGNTKVTAGVESPVLLLPKKGRSRKCRITKLPTEILLQIAEYLLPTDTSFHVFPSTWQPYGGYRSTVIHKFSIVASESEDRVIPGIHSHTREHLTALAQTCHVLSEAYYEIMYGRNHFIFELFSHEAYPMIEGPATPPVESWTKVLRGKREGMWPLTERSIPHIRHLTILGTLLWEDTKVTRTALRKHLLSAIELLQHAQHLNCLTVDLRYSPQPYISKVSVPMSQIPPTSPEPNANTRLGWGVKGPQDTVLRLRDVVAYDGHPGMVELWRLFENLRGFRDVVLSGHITAELAEGLCAQMMTEPELLLPTKAAKKHRGKGLKRKRAEESLPPLKSRRRV